MAGFREFLTGEVLSAANVNNFLMEQATMTFADAAARDAALASVLREGLLTYNLDTNRLEVYDGTAWVEPAPEPPAPPAGIGSNVVQGVTTALFSTSSTTFVDVPSVSATITPSSATSKILVMAYAVLGNSNLNHGTQIQILRGATAIFQGNPRGSAQRVSGGYAIGGSSPELFAAGFSPVFLDSPSTDSPVTYKLQARRSTAGTSLVGGTIHTGDTRGVNAPTSIIVIEVAP